MAQVVPEASPPEPALKSLDNWWTVLFVDWLAVRLVRLVRDVAVVTPTRLTVLAHVLGVLTAGAFLAGHLVLAAAVFEIRFVIDCADGKLARVRGTSSAAGRYLDHVGDNLVVALNLAGLGLHLERAGELPWYGAIALVGAFLGHVVAAQAREIEATGAGVGERRVEQQPGRYAGWMAARRLRPVPGRIDVEHLLLFVVPLVATGAGAPHLVAWMAWVATAFFAYRAARMTIAGYLVAAGRDRAERPPAGAAR